MIPVMASIRERKTKTGTTTYSVVYRHAGRQSSTTFTRRQEAAKFARTVEALGPDEALTRLVGDPVKALTVPTLGEWVGHHIEHLAGVTVLTRQGYRSMTAKHLGPLEWKTGATRAKLGKPRV